MLAVDAQGTARKFGSRRHYCFSHSGYRQQCRDIVERLARRYGSNKAIAAWQQVVTCEAANAEQLGVAVAIGDVADVDA